MTNDNEQGQESLPVGHIEQLHIAAHKEAEQGQVPKYTWDDEYEFIANDGVEMTTIDVLQRLNTLEAELTQHDAAVDAREQRVRQLEAQLEAINADDYLANLRRELAEAKARAVDGWRIMRGERDAALEQVKELKARIESLFVAIEHGEPDHRAWLKGAIDEHFVLKADSLNTGDGNG